MNVVPPVTDASIAAADYPQDAQVVDPLGLASFSAYPAAGGASQSVWSTLNAFESGSTFAFTPGILDFWHATEVLRVDLASPATQVILTGDDPAYSGSLVTLTAFDEDGAVVDQNTVDFTGETLRNVAVAGSGIAAVEVTLSGNSIASLESMDFTYDPAGTLLGTTLTDVNGEYAYVPSTAAGTGLTISATPPSDNWVQTVPAGGAPIAYAGPAAGSVGRDQNFLFDKQLDIGPDVVADEGSVVTLHGPTGPTLTYSWAVTSDNGQVLPAGADADYAFTPDDNGLYLVSLTTLDTATLDSFTDTLVVLASNVAPSVDIGSDQTIELGQQASFGAAVSDPGSADTIAAYAWTLRDAADVVVATGAGPSFNFAPAATGTYTLELAVTDDDGAVGADTAALTVVADATGPVVLARQRNGGAYDPAVLDAIGVTFSESVGGSIGKGDLLVTDYATGDAVDLSNAGFAYDGATFNATWDLAALGLAPGRYTLTIPSAGVTDAAGNALDGDANGVPGGDYVLSLLVARPGDANLDGSVDAADYILLKRNFGTTGGATWRNADFTGDSKVDRGDLNVLMGSLGDKSSPQPVSAQQNGGADQPNVLNAFSVTFSEDVGTSISTSDLAVTNDLTASPVDTSSAGFAYDGQTFRASWDFSSLGLPAGRYTLTIPSWTVSDAAGNAMDGDANGTAGGDYSLSILVAPTGDVNVDGAVDTADYIAVKRHFGTASGATWQDGDLTGDGSVNGDDLGVLIANLGYSIDSPALAPLAAAAPSAVSAPATDSGGSVLASATAGSSPQTQVQTAEEDPQVDLLVASALLPDGLPSRSQAWLALLHGPVFLTPAASKLNVPAGGHVGQLPALTRPSSAGDVGRFAKSASHVIGPPARLGKELLDVLAVPALDVLATDQV